MLLSPPARACRAALAAGLVLAAGLAAPARAQTPAPRPGAVRPEAPRPEAVRPEAVRPDVRPRSALSPSRLPPLPDSLRLYGATVPVVVALPTFGPPPTARALTLDEAIALALARNPDRLGALLDAETARREAVPEAAGFAPTLDADADLSGTATVPLFADSTARARRSSGLGAGLTGSYVVFDGFRRDATLRRLRAAARGAALDADAFAEDLAFAVVEAYVAALRQERLVAAREEAVAVSEDRLRIEQARVGIGVAAEVEAALALADLNSDRAALVRQRLAAQQARLALGRLIALDDPDALRLAESLPDPAAPAALDARALARTAEATSRVLRAFDARADAAREAVREVEAERFPTVRATAGLTADLSDGAGLVPLLDPRLAPGLRYGLSARLPILDAGSRRRRLAAARDRLVQTDLARDAAAQRLRADLGALAAQADGQLQLLALEDANVAVARQNVRVALAQQELGLISALDLRQIQLSLVDAETRRVDALAALVTARAELQARTGRLLPPEAALAD